MNASHRRWIGFGGALGALALLGGCVATGPYGYDDYPYDPYYGSGPAVVTPGVDLNVYSYPGYRAYPSAPYYGPGYRGYRNNDPRWGYGRQPRAVPVPVPVPVPTPGIHGGRPGPGAGGRPPVFVPRSAPGQPPSRPAQSYSPLGRGTLQGGQPRDPGSVP